MTRRPEATKPTSLSEFAIASSVNAGRGPSRENQASLTRNTFLLATFLDQSRPKIPLTSLIFGYGPMLPLAAAAVGIWVLSPPWPVIATKLAIIWGAMLLVFVAGVRRGYGFGDPNASTAREITVMLVYFVLGGVSLVLADLQQPAGALELQILGFTLVAVLDRRAALVGDAPRHFEGLRGPQMFIAATALLVVLLQTLSIGGHGGPFTGFFKPEPF